MKPNDELLNAFGQANNAAGFRAGREEGAVLGVIGVTAVFCLLFGGIWLYHHHRVQELEARAQQLQREQKPVPTPSHSPKVTLV